MAIIGPPATIVSTDPTTANTFNPNEITAPATGCLSNHPVTEL